MRTNLERALNTLITAGWANQSDGDVESPTGHFAIIDMTTERDMMRDVLVESGEDASIMDDIPSAWFVVITDSAGNIWPAQCSSARRAADDFARLGREYLAWADTDD